MSDMKRLPREYAPLVYGVIQAAVTTGVATAIAVFQAVPLGQFLPRWLLTWGLAWLTMLPVVVTVAPLIQRAVWALTVKEHERGI